ncbi:hypothetical protein [Cecembia sp.]|uniref:hypothetical protein n=1 Tax=Cecembia sp. TaxID=1898110 RepID=UPI0025B9E487|nr:hypothetical protein [Cecembia sp.]
MAGGTSAFNMVQSSKDNKSIRSGRSRKAENPYNSSTVRNSTSNPAVYDELIAESFERRDSQEFSRKIVLFIFGILVFLSISLFFI